MTNTLHQTTLFTSNDFAMPEHRGGDHWTILHGDAMRIVPQFERNVFDAVITDPPYASGGASQTMTDALQWAGWTWRGIAVWDKPSGRPQRGRFRQQAEFIVWGSNGKMPLERNVGCLPGVFRQANPANRIHVTEKPLQLMRDVVQICTPGGRILDPFAGSGTTVLAAVQEGYEAVGIELTDAYFQLGTQRVEQALESQK